MIPAFSHPGFEFSSLNLWTTWYSNISNFKLESSSLVLKQRELANTEIYTTEWLLGCREAECSRWMSSETDQSTGKFLILFCAVKGYSWHSKILSPLCTRGWIAPTKNKGIEEYYSQKYIWYLFIMKLGNYNFKATWNSGLKELNHYLDVCVGKNLILLLSMRLHLLKIKGSSRCSYLLNDDAYWIHNLVTSVKQWGKYWNLDYWDETNKKDSRILENIDPLLTLPLNP